ncbi:MAG: TetR/AcrR family transcriptional regulator [bacterium]
MKTNIEHKIIRSAIKLFVQKGFFNTTVDEIAHSAKIAKGTVYLYFKDKSDIYIEIIKGQLNEALEDLMEIKSENLNSTEKLRKIAEKWLFHSVYFHRLFPILSMENINQALKIMRGVKFKVFPIINDIVTEIKTIIEQGIKRGEFRDINPQVAAVCFLNIIRTPFLLSIFSAGKTPHPDEILELFFDGLNKKRS